MDSHSNIEAMSSLCFSEHDFVAEEFSVDKFLSEGRKYTSLETMRKHLNMYHKTLYTAMVDLINKDYVDFVNLSTNLVGLEKSINNLNPLLLSLKNEIGQVKTTLDGSLDSAGNIFSDRAKAHSSKVSVYHIVCVLQGLEKISELNSTTEKDEDLLQLERIAFSFNAIKFHLQKVSGIKDLTQKEEVVQEVAENLEERLESAFLQSLSSHDAQNLHKILQIYSVIGEEKKVEDCFRQGVVRPFMKDLITQSNVTTHGLSTVYKGILDFIPVFCGDVLKITHVTNRQTEVIPGFDFLIHAVWPEVITCFEHIAPFYLYSVGDTQLFHQNYSASMKFLDQFEASCGDQKSVRKLRESSSYKEFIAKWNLDVYFQIRFQEIASEFENSLFKGFLKSEDEKLPYVLHATLSLWSCVNLCWSNAIFLPPLKHNFWRLTLQLLSRYRGWAHSSIEQTNDGVAQIALLIKDVELLVSRIKEFFVENIHPKLSNEPSMNGLFEAAFNDASKLLEDIPPFAGDCMVKLLIEKCTSHLKWITNIPQRFRKTNHEIPSKPSPYVSQVFNPLTEFLLETSSVLSSTWIQFCEREVTDGIMKQCMVQMTDVLTSIKKMEDSLKILKRARDKPTGKVSSGVLTDDDKIRRQLTIDVNYFEEMILKMGLQTNNVKTLKELKEIVTSAERIQGFPLSS